MYTVCATNRYTPQSIVQRYIQTRLHSNKTNTPVLSETYLFLTNSILYINYMYMYNLSGRRGGLMVSALVSGSSGPGSSPGLGHCVVFLGKTLYSHSASLHPGV